MVDLPEIHSKIRKELKTFSLLTGSIPIASGGTACPPPLFKLEFSLITVKQILCVLSHANFCVQQPFCIWKPPTASAAYSLSSSSSTMSLGRRGHDRDAPILYLLLFPSLIISYGLQDTEIL